MTHALLEIGNLRCYYPLRRGIGEFVTGVAAKHVRAVDLSMRFEPR